MVARLEGVRARGGKGEEIEYRLAVPDWSQGREVQHGEYGLYYCDNYVWCYVGTRIIGEPPS